MLSGNLLFHWIDQENNLWYCETISATNPCGEIPLPAYGACDLGSINLTCFVNQPFDKTAQLDLEAIKTTTSIAVRMLDNVIELSHYPLPIQQDTIQASRRIGLGITGLADALVMLGVKYGTLNSFKIAATIMKAIRDSAYDTSIALAKEKGAFPLYQTERHLQGPFIQKLPIDIQKKSKKMDCVTAILLLWRQPAP